MLNKNLLASLFYLSVISLIFYSCQDDSDEEIIVSRIGLIAKYMFDGNAKDDGPNEFHGVNRGAELVEDRHGNRRSAYRFTAGAFIDCGESQHFDLKQYKEFSISVWVKPDHTQVQATQTILSRYAPGDRYFYLSLNDSDKLHFRFYTNNPTIGSTWYQTSSTFDSSWQHLVVTKDMKSLKLYINNELASETPLESTTSSNPTNWPKFMIGAVHFSNHAFDLKFSGRIDDIYVYGRKLGLHEIEFLYNN